MASTRLAHGRGSTSRRRRNSKCVGTHSVRGPIHCEETVRLSTVPCRAPGMPVYANHHARCCETACRGENTRETTDLPARGNTRGDTTWNEKSVVRLGSERIRRARRAMLGDSTYVRTDAEGAVRLGERVGGEVALGHELHGVKRRIVSVLDHRLLRKLRMRRDVRWDRPRYLVKLVHVERAAAVAVLRDVLLVQIALLRLARVRHEVVRSGVVRDERPSLFALRSERPRAKARHGTDFCAGERAQRKRIYPKKTSHERRGEKSCNVSTRDCCWDVRFCLHVAVLCAHRRRDDTSHRHTEERRLLLTSQTLIKRLSSP